MKRAVFAGFSFGLTSAVITTLGLMVGLFSAIQSKIVVIGGILTIAIADSFSDALGIHISKESEKDHSKKQVWIATFSTFCSKLILTLSFLIPVLLFELKIAIIISAIYGLIVLSILSFHIGLRNKENTFKVVLEHLIIGIVVIFITYYLGRFVSVYFA
jgi:vacuolar iron transporter family protein